MIPEVIRSGNFSNSSPNPQTIKLVESLMTPENILGQKEFGTVYAIPPWEYPSFDHLLKSRELIRQLKLLPVKTDSERERYKSENHEMLQQRLYSLLGDSMMVLAKNAYPYWLPEDVAQYLVWIRDKRVSRQEIITFTSQCAEHLSLGKNDLILFERSLHTTQPLIKGSFQQMRHIHFWFRDRKQIY